MFRTQVALLVLVGSLIGGCGAEVEGSAHANLPRVYVPEPSAAIVFSAPPPLVTIGPEVAVVQDYDYPVYYTGGAYWYARGGVWYHTAHWNEPWVAARVDAVPTGIVHLDHRAYVHYHGDARAHVWRAEAEMSSVRVAAAKARADAAAKVHAETERREAEAHHAADVAAKARADVAAKESARVDVREDVDVHADAQATGRAEAGGKASSHGVGKKPTKRPASKEEEKSHGRRI